jgi:hypothetical protein
LVKGINVAKMRRTRISDTRAETIGLHPDYRYGTF